MEPDDRQRFWFRAMPYGYGWLAPRTWQGWLAVAPILLAMVLLPILAEDRRAPLVALGLIGVVLTLWGCVKHGEPARWRWGRHG